VERRFYQIFIVPNIVELSKMTVDIVEFSNMAKIVEFENVEFVIV
jgi:hypothetical protein